MSTFYIAIRRTDGTEVQLRPGGHGERELTSALTTAVLARGVGLFRTEAQVRTAIEAGLQEVLLALKSEVLPG